MVVSSVGLSLDLVGGFSVVGCLGWFTGWIGVLLVGFCVCGIVDVVCGFGGCDFFVWGGGWLVVWVFLVLVWCFSVLW